jgi:hypothetical protein
MVGAAGGSPAEALAEVRLRAPRFGGPPSRSRESEGWAHFEFTRINIAPTILRKKIEESLEILSSCPDLLTIFDVGVRQWVSRSRQKYQQISQWVAGGGRSGGDAITRVGKSLKR